MKFSMVPDTFWEEILILERISEIKLVVEEFIGFHRYVETRPLEILSVCCEIIFIFIKQQMHLYFSCQCF